MDNGLLCEPTTTNLAAKKIDVTNASLNNWISQLGSGTFEVSAKETYSHSHSIHIKNGSSNMRVAFTVGSSANTIYTLSCMAFVVSGKLKVRIEESTGSWPGTTSQGTQETGKWVKESVSYTTTNEEHAIWLFFYAEEGDDVYIDDIQLEARPYATSFTPTSRDAADRLTIAEWVVNKPTWTCEFDLSVNDKQNLEWAMLFARAGWLQNPGGKMFRFETNEAKKGLRGGYLSPIWADDATTDKPQRFAVTFENSVAALYFNGNFIGSNTDVSSNDVLSSIWMGDCITNPFNGCFKNFRFSSTVHTAEKIAADSKLDELPVEDDTVLYMPLKEDLSMYGKAVQ